MSDIKFVIAKVKGYVKRYTTKSGTKKESNVKQINLGSNAPFKDGDTVFVIDKMDYANIMDGKDKENEIESLNAQLTDTLKKYHEMSLNYHEVFQESNTLRKEQKTLQKKLDECIENRESLHNALHEAQGEINQKDQIIMAYKSMGLLKRIRHYDPEQDVMIETSKKN